MLGTDLVSPRHLGNNCSRSIRFRDDPALLLLAPATPAANAGPDFNPATRPRSVKYIVNHIGEPIPPDPPTSADFSMSPQGAVKRPLTLGGSRSVPRGRVRGAVSSAAWWAQASPRGVQLRRTIPRFCQRNL